MRRRIRRSAENGFSLERLEARWVMSGLPLISEFMALNENTLQDQDGDYSDWVEIYNPGPDDFNLADWYLTDDAAVLDKWEFPAQTLTAGSFLVVFASDKDRSVAGQELHANFKLSGDGEFLGLTRRAPLPGDPNHIEVVSAYDPSFGLQHPDIAYGVEQSVSIADLVAEGGPGKMFFPTSNSLHPAWTQQNFVDAAFTTATSAIGYEESVPGFTVRNFKSLLPVSSLSDAEAVISTESLQASVTTAITPVVNFLGTGGTGHFSSDLPFPGSVIGNDVDDFAIEAVGTIIIPAAGNWSFGVNSDDGFKLQIGAFTSQYNDPRGPADTFATFNFASAGTYPLRLVMYERGGGAEVELFAAQGSLSAFSSAFKLVGSTATGGLAVETSPSAGGTSGFSSYIDTDVETTMVGNRATVYMRAPFTIADPSSLDSLTLRVRYDDAFVAYLNGVEVARRNAPATVVYNSVAATNRPETLAVLQENIDLTEYLGLLTSGQTNILAIHGLNDAIDSNEFLLTAELAEITVTNGQLRYFQSATPGDYNPASGFVDFVAAPTFSVPHGFKSSTFQLSLASPTPGAQIRYTTDGSAPTASTGTVYGSPISISNTRTVRAAAFKSGFQPSPVETASYVFVNDVITQSPNGEIPAGFPASGVNGQEMNYGMDPNVVNHPSYSALIDDALLAIPSVSVVMNSADLFSPSTGIYVNAFGEGRQWERPASVELINPDGSQGFQIDAGIRIRGGYSRSGGNPKHAFRLFFRDEYDGNLKFPLFGDEGVDEFENVDLRTAQNYSWSFDGSSLNTMNRDVFSRDLQRDLGDPYTRSRYYHLYLNGQYWGLFQTQERSEASFGASYFGGDKEDYDVVKAEAGPYTIAVTDGNLTAWQAFWDGANAVASEADPATRFALFQKLKGLNPDGTRNAAHPVLLDSRNLIDYMLTIYYGGNLDAPISNFLGNTAVNNFFAVRNRNSDEGWRFFAHDNEHTLLNVNEDRTGPFSAGSQFQHSNPQWIFQQLWECDEFRLEVADRVQATFFNNGPLTPAANTARFMARKNEIDLPIIAESARWGDSKREPAYTKTDWQNTINSIVNGYFPQRTNVVLQQLRGDGLYPDVDVPQHIPNGGSVASGHEVQFANAEGVIYYTTDGSDPRAPLGAPSPMAIAYNTVSTYVDSASSGLKYRVPNGSTSEAGWQTIGYNDASWTSGQLPVGFDTGAVSISPGFLVRTVDTSSGDIPSISTATSLLNGNTSGFTIANDSSTVMAYVNLGDSGDLSSPANQSVPGTADREQYAIRVTADITIPVGTWTLAVGSDDGFRLTIPGVTFTNQFNGTGPTGTNSFEFSAPRGHSQTGAAFTRSGTALTTTIQLDFYERTGGDSLELSLASGSQAGFNGSFAILQNGTQGWSVTTPGAVFDYDPLIETDVESAMYNQRGGAYLRLPFTASNVADVQALTLRMRYDDGFVAYLNGNIVASRNAPATPTFSSTATTSRADTQAVIFEAIDISAYKQHLVNGNNVLAIHGLNVSVGDTDYFLDAQLDSYSVGAGTPLTQSAIVNARTLNNGEWSALSSAEFFLNTPASAANLAITELHYNPSAVTQPEIDAGFTDNNDFEFVELRNIGAQRIDLAGSQFTAGITFNFSGSAIVALDPGDYVVVAANLNAFEFRYGTGLPVAGAFSGSLSSQGELITLQARNGAVIDSFTYDDGGAWPGRADGSGSSLEVIDVAGDYNLSANWRSSGEFDGSPGAAGLGILGDVVVNEVLSHTDLPLKDSVELYNTTGGDINIGGWYLSDSNDNYKKYRIADGTMIPAHSYRVFDEDDFNPNPGSPGPNDFSFSSSEGDDVWLLAADGAGKLTRFVEHAEFQAAANGVSFGRWPNGSGDLFPMTEPTFGDDNSGPLFGPVVISEVMYDPTAAAGDDDLEFIELFNTTGSPISLGNWRISGGVDHTFATGSSIPGNGTLVVVRFNPTDTAKADTFRNHYGIGMGVTLVGPYGPAVLDNGGETIKLERPDEPPPTNPTLIPYLLVDQVKYDDDAPWPTSPKGTGDSLARLATDAFGDFSTSWTGDAPTPGSTAFTGNNAPTISAIGDRTIGEDGSTGAINFTVGDVETPVGSLTVSGSSSNTSLVPNGNITFGGTGVNRTITVTPAGNQFGTATITITVSDGQDPAVETFVLSVTSVNDVPTITAIADRAINEDTSTGGISFTIGDVETAVGALQLTGTSSNTTLAPNTNIVFGGSGANRTVTVTPAENQSGTATITVTLSDGTDQAVETFLLSVDAVNDLPTITAIDDVAINEDGSTGAISFTIGDVETAVGALQVSGSSSNTTLAPHANIVFGGSGANRTVTVTPVGNQFGTSTITITIGDGTAQVVETFLLSVNSVNDLPTITAIDDVTIDEDGSTGAISFTIGDVETAVGALQVSGSSSNTTLAPNANIVFGGNGANRTVTVTPAAGRFGAATITVTVSDGAGSALETFVLSVNELPAVPGDTNGDGKVDLADLNNVRNFFGAVGPGVTGDTNGDDVVDLADLNNVRNNFGAGTGGAPQANLASRSAVATHSLTLSATGTTLSVDGATVLFARRKGGTTVREATAADSVFAQADDWRPSWGRTSSKSRRN